MNPIQLSLELNREHEVSGWIFVALFVAIVLWLWSVVVIAKEKTEDPYDRIVWLLIVLLLNFIGTLLYFFFAGNGKSNKDAVRSERELKRRANEGTL
jgi:Phospholipase_D-nuclease N-terminal